MAKANQIWTKTAFAKVPKLYATEHTPKDKKVAHVKIFSIRSDHRHYVLEYDTEEGLAFVLTTNQGVIEYGYLSIPEVQELNDNFRQHGFRCPPFEREIHGTPAGGYTCQQIEEAHAKGTTP